MYSVGAGAKAVAGRDQGMLTRRRILVSLAGAGYMAAAPAFAQADKTLRLGAIASGAPFALDGVLGKILVATLADLGYSPGRNLTFATRGAMANFATLPTLVGELKSEGAEILLAVGYPCAVAAKDAGIATVAFIGVGDPVATGLVESWAHPGGIVTGVSDNATTLTIKRLELLREFQPQMKRIAMLWNVDDRAMTLRYEASAATAQMQGLTVQPLAVREPDDFNGAFAAMDRDRPDAILMVSDALTVLNRKRVYEYAASRRLPAIYENDSFARDGGLMSYAADQRDSVTRAASMVDRIFKGARPGDIPFEQPTRYLFVINLKTANALGIQPPVDLLARADEVIE
jgi:putative tryptophan/tyrosine transport system substrate-binding protein